MQLQPQITYAEGVGEGALTLYNTIIPTLFPKLGLLMFHLNIIRTIGPINDRKFPDCITKFLNTEQRTTSDMLTAK